MRVYSAGINSLFAVMVTLSACGSLPDEQALPSPVQVPDAVVAPAASTAVVPQNPQQANPQPPEDDGPRAVPLKDSESPMVLPPAEIPAASESIPAGTRIGKPPSQDKPGQETSVIKSDKRRLNTFHVTLAKKEAKHPQFGVGHDIGFAVDGIVGKEVVVERGQAYFFEVETDIKHDFYLATNSVGWGSGVLTDGVKGNFTYQGSVEFKPTATTPGIVYYQCRNHKAMGWKIHVVNKGEKPVQLGKANDPAMAVPTPPTEGNVAAAVGEVQVRQKVQFAKTLLSGSAALKRVETSNHLEAKTKIQEALQALAQADKYLTQKQWLKAQDQADVALKNLTLASQMVPARVSRPIEDLREEYDNYLKGIHSFKASYDRTVARLKKEKGTKAAILPVNFDQINSRVEKAKHLASVNKYEEANDLLLDAQSQITAALNKMLASQTVVYEMKFETAQEEYQYEITRFDSYAELIPLAIERKHPSPETVKMMETYTSKGRQIMQQADGYAKKGDYKTALLGVQEAIKAIQQALRLVGV